MNIRSIKKSKRNVPMAASKNLKPKETAVNSSFVTPRTNGMVALLVVFLAWYGQHFFTMSTKGKILDESTLYKTLLQELLTKPSQQRQPFAFVVPDLSDNVDDNQMQAAVDDAVNKASEEFNLNEKQAGKAAWIFLSSLATSSTFVQQYWHQRPVVIRAKDVAAITSTIGDQSKDKTSSSWVAGAFTVEHHFRMIENSYITGFRTGDGLRNGSDTSSWGYEPIISGEVTGRSQWSEFQQQLEGGTIYFNAAGSLWPNLGALCRLTQYAFGIPTNVNVYATPANVTISVPPHTDQQDVFVMQTEGSKHWRVFAPLKVLANKAANVAMDPTDRGKHGDALTKEELGTPLLDTVLHTGDILYVPIGFPHTTDTANLAHESEDKNSESSKTSVHLTMGLDTHVWSLTWADLRSTVLRRSGKDSSWDVVKNNPENKDDSDNLYWALLQSLPMGAFGGEAWRNSWKRILRRRSARRHTSGLDLEYRKKLIEETKKLLVRLEPKRWMDAALAKKSEKSDENKYLNQETLPVDRDIGEVVDFLLSEHLLSIMMVQQEFFSDVDPYDESTGIRAFLALQKNNAIMERFAKFSKNEAMHSQFVQKRLATDAMMQGLVM